MCILIYIIRHYPLVTWETLVTVNSLPVPDLTISIWATVVTFKTIPYFPFDEHSEHGLVILGMA